ncbi:MAG: hypothetical protein IKM59_00130 [Oscillospiraceae bacterium]|nr:hypothetical protein [Oscillospiraceae bacterium]
MYMIYSGLSAQNVSDMVMGFSGVMNVVFLVVVLLFGAYGLYGVRRLKKEQDLIPHRLMYPLYCSHEDCLDPVEYMDFIIPRITVLSVVMILSGLALLVSFFIPVIRTMGFTLAVYVIPLAVYLWYNGSVKRAKKKYW